MLALAAAMTGCASLPRIDPTGRRLLVWPDSSAALPAPPGAVPGLGNVNAAPVFAGDNPALGGTAGAPGAVGTTVQSPADERLSITPERLLAPVGSEVVLKAGVCAKEGYLRTNRRIEWMLGQEGAGQFVTVGERGEMDILRLPWERPNKRDNSYAVGYTAPFSLCLRRGDEDPSNDVQVEPGEAWITLTSASEGVSYVTATAPESDGWDARRAVATVYWVDAQWRLPEPISLQPGQTGTLTTTVTRRSDGAPVKGWLVRYEVVQGATARLGYEAGQASEAETDAQGRASVAITPTDDRPGSAVVRVTIVRPATSAPMPAPRLELGSGDATVAWTPSAVGGTPPPPTGPPISSGPNPPQPPAPFEPAPTEPGDTIGDSRPRVGPQIEVSVERATTGALRAGDPIPLSITLRNTGDAPAENLTLGVQYDRGLSSPADTEGRFELSRSDLPDLAPGDSSVIDLDLTAVDPGKRCANVTVTADRMAAAFERACFDIQSPPPPAAPKLRIQTALDAVGTVGGTVTYLATVYNEGTERLDGLRVEVLNRPQLEAAAADPGDFTLLPNGLAWEGRSVPAGGSLSYTVRYKCLAPVGAAEVQIYALYGQDRYETKLDGVEIRTAATVPSAVPPAARRPDLDTVVSSSANPARVGQPATLSVAITNTTPAGLRNVQYRLLFPPQLRPTVVPGAVQNGNALEFAPIDSLATGETFRFAVPYTPIDGGVVSVVAQTRVGADGAPGSAETTISVSAR